MGRDRSGTATRSWWRRRSGDEPESPGPGAALREDEHAWWAARDQLTERITARQATGLNPTDPAELRRQDQERRRSFLNEWTTESLFGDDPFNERGGAQPAGGGTIDQPSAFVDSDEAHLALGVPIGASKDEIAAAYRGLAKRYHPDLLGDASPDAQRLGADRMAEANVALATLRHLHRGP